MNSMSHHTLLREMAKVLPYQYESEPTATKLTGYAGLLPYLDLICLLGLLEAVDKEVKTCGKQGWMDRQYALALWLLNLAGGDCMADIRMLEEDAGLCQVVRAAERHGLSRKERCAMERGRQLFVRLARGHPALAQLMEIRRRISLLAPASAVT